MVALVSIPAHFFYPNDRNLNAQQAVEQFNDLLKYINEHIVPLTIIDKKQCETIENELKTLDFTDSVPGGEILKRFISFIKKILRQKEKNLPALEIQLATQRQFYTECANKQRKRESLPESTPSLMKQRVEIKALTSLIESCKAGEGQEQYGILSTYRASLNLNPELKISEHINTLKKRPS